MKLSIIGKMNLRSKLTTIFLGFVLCVSAQKNNYPQSIIFKGDSVIVFSREQALRITEINEENKSNKKLIHNKDSIIGINNEMLSICDSTYKSTLNLYNECNSLIKLKDYQLNSYIENEKKLKEEIEKQKKHKTYAIIGGCSILFLSYLNAISK